MKRRILRNIKRNSGTVKTRTPLKAHKNYKGRILQKQTTVTLVTGKRRSKTCVVVVGDPNQMLADAINALGLSDTAATMAYGGETYTYTPLVETAPVAE